MSGMMVAIIGAMGAVIAALITALIGQRIIARKDLTIAELKVRQELEIEYDRDLRARRIDHYEKLWTCMKPLARYPAPDPLSYADLKRLSEALRDWYYEGGGLFLTEKTRENYFDLQDGCKIVLQKQEQSWPAALGETGGPSALRVYLQRADEWEASPAILRLAGSQLSKPGGSPPKFRDDLPAEIFEQLRALGSALRSSMTEGVLTRRPAYLSKVPTEGAW